MSEVLNEVFSSVLVASRDAAVLALAVAFILFLVGRKIPAAWRHGFWMLIVIRLLLPELPDSTLSWQRLIPVNNPVLAEVPAANTPVQPREIPALHPEPEVGPQHGSTVPEMAVLAEPGKPTMVAETLPTEFDWKQAIFFIWLAGVAANLALIFVLDMRFRQRVRGLTKHDSNDFENVRNLLARVAREQSVRPPALRITEAVPVPAISGLIRPTILLPSATLERLDETELRLVLLHELAHLHRRDLWLNWLLALLQVVHWFNPVIWWAFHRVRAEAEGAADAWVLHRCGAETPSQYGEALLRLLEVENPRRRIAVPGVVGVVESPRDLRSRIQMIARFSRKRNRLAAVGTVALIVGLAAVGLTQAPVRNENDSVLNTIRALDRATGKTLEGASISIEGKPAGSDDTWKSETATNGNGEVVFSLPSKLSRARAVVRKQGYTSHFAWVSTGTTITFHLDPVATIGGRIVDPEGAPIAGARVEVRWNSIQKGVPREEYHWSIDDPEEPILTANDGTWSYSLGPDDFSLLDQNGLESRAAPHALRLKAVHPEYSSVELRDGPQDWRSLLLARTAEIVLFPDARLTGRILDVDGNPIPNALVRELFTSGRSGKESLSHDDGTFAIYLKAGSHRLYVEKEGFASRILPTSATRTKENHVDDLTLTKAPPLRIHIHDTEGRPVSDASFHANLDSTTNLKSFKTDENGVVIWSSPPASDTAWTFTCFKRGYFAKRDQNGKTDDNHLVVTMQKAITVTGKVTDAATGKPVQKFKLVTSQKLPNGTRVWYGEDTRPNSNAEGRFQFSITETDQTMFRVEAEGYIGRESRDYNPETAEKRIIENVALDPIPADKESGIRILEPDGRNPAAGASLTLGGNERATFQFRDLAHPRDVHPSTSESTANDSGILPFPNSPSPQKGWITHPMGYLPLNTIDLKRGQTQPLVLLPYAKVAGNLIVDGGPGASRTLVLQTSIPLSGRNDLVDFWTVTVRTDQSGNFSTDQLVPSEVPYRIKMVDSETGKEYPDTIALFRVGTEPVAPLKLAFQIASRVRVTGQFVTSSGESLEGTHFLNANLHVNQTNAPVEFFDFVQPKPDGSFETPPYLPGTYRLSGFIQFSNTGEVLFEERSFHVPAEAIKSAREGIYDIGDIPID